LGSRSLFLFALFSGDGYLNGPPGRALMIISFTAVALLCAILAWYAKERTERLIFVAFCVLNIIAGVVAIAEGNAFKWLPYDPSDTAMYRR
jgi:hypothetical protein